MKHLGDFAPARTIRHKFNTYSLTGEPITLAGSPAVAVYKDGGTSESTAGVTLSVNFDGRTGLHQVAIDTSADAAFYTPGSDFSVVITVGTVDGVNVAGTEICSFSLANRSAPLVMHTTTIATLASQLSFTLATGSGDNDAYKHDTAVFTDATTATQKGKAPVAGYDGPTKRVTLATAPPFAIAVGDIVDLVMTSPRLDAAVSTAGVVSDINDETVPPQRTWHLKASSDDVLVGEETFTLAVGKTQTFAVDFSSDLPTNGRVLSINAQTIKTGTAGGVTFGTAGREDSQAKPKLTGVTAGTYELDFDVTYDNGDTQKGRVTLKVID